MGRVITFYSYKGGVGRSMALANTGVLLSQWGYNVLMVDFDLEAPGLENFFSSYIDIECARNSPGVIDMFCSAFDDEPHPDEISWHEGIVDIKLPRSKGKLHLLTAGKRSDDYFRKVRRVDIPLFYSHCDGGNVIENLRNQWKTDYDFVLIDSRTGNTEIGGICTVQFPDVIVAFFTATEQAFAGAIDIVNRAASARQRLPFARPLVPVVPIPSRFDTRAEFKLSQRWLDRFERDLNEIYANWLPRKVRPRTLLDLIKLPHVSYFSFGERLPVLEHGTVDPSGLGYAYESLAALIAKNLQDVIQLIDDREDYVKTASHGRTKSELTSSKANIFVSYSRFDDRMLDRLRTVFKPLMEENTFTAWSDMELGSGTKWVQEISEAISNADVAVLLVSADYLASDFITRHEFPKLLSAAEQQGLAITWILVSHCLYEQTEISQFQAAHDVKKPLESLSPSELDETLVHITRRIMELAATKAEHLAYQ